MIALVPTETTLHNEGTVMMMNDLIVNNTSEIAMRMISITTFLFIASKIPSISKLSSFWPIVAGNNARLFKS